MPLFRERYRIARWRQSSKETAMLFRLTVMRCQNFESMRIGLLQCNLQNHRMQSLKNHLLIGNGGFNSVNLDDFWLETFNHPSTLRSVWCNPSKPTEFLLRRPFSRHKQVGENVHSHDVLLPPGQFAFNPSVLNAASTRGRWSRCTMRLKNLGSWRNAPSAAVTHNLANFTLQLDPHVKAFSLRRVLLG
jgi:hypothetical protein